MSLARAIVKNITLNMRTKKFSGAPLTQSNVNSQTKTTGHEWHCYLCSLERITTTGDILREEQVGDRKRDVFWWSNLHVWLIVEKVTLHSNMQLMDWVICKATCHGIWPTNNKTLMDCRPNDQKNCTTAQHVKSEVAHKNKYKSHKHQCACSNCYYQNKNWPSPQHVTWASQ